MLLTRERTAKSQIGSQTDLYGGPYTQGGGDISFAPGQMIFIRFPTILPRKASINSATIKFNMVVKNAGTAQNSSHRIWAHASGDSPMLIMGTNNWSNREYTANVVNWTATWNANEDQTVPGGVVYRTVDITSIISELVWRDDWVPGGYITLMILCDNENGSDMGIRANNDFLPTPRVEVDYVEPIFDERNTINMCENSEFGTAVQAIGTDGNVAPFWGQNTFYDAFVNTSTQTVPSSFTRDTSFTRVPGLPTLRFTAGTAAPNNDKRTGPYYAVTDNVDYKAVFCGWLYIPSSVPQGMVQAYDAFSGGSTGAINVRDQWTPFCTNPIQLLGTGFANYWLAISFDSGYQAGWQFWLSEPALIRSNFRQMPFNGKTPNRDPGIVHSSTSSGMASSRTWTPKRNFKLDGVFNRAYPTWTKRADGIMQLTEPVKGGPTSANMPATQIQNYDPAKTISEY